MGNRSLYGQGKIVLMPLFIPYEPVDAGLSPYGTLQFYVFKLYISHFEMFIFSCFSDDFRGRLF